ncbi:MAG: hypothetical protein GY721_05850 [Deltaproteobacteria bacterium]|nr:hypothetical protein [Deltaproteobacteria bacterium]
MANKRIVSWFSCGAASAYATYLAHEAWLKAPRGRTFHAVYCRVREESEDNMRFLMDFQDSTGIPIEVIGDDSMNCSIYDVFLKRKFIKGPLGAPCTMILKKWQRQEYEKPDDVQVFGYTVEEEDRVDRFIDGNNHVDAWFILYDQGITKPQCLEFIADRGIEVPLMYRLGYQNNNCVGCVKGGMGYWNAIRVDFPEAFERMAKLERTIGHAVNKDKDGPVYLDVLATDRGNFKRDSPGDCGFTCETK